MEWGPIIGENLCLLTLAIEFLPMMDSIPILRMLRRCGSSIGNLQQTPTERPHGFGRLVSSVRMSLEKTFISELIDWTEKSTQNRISENSVKRDVDCFFRTYVPSRLTKTNIMEDTFDCPLVELNLISDSIDGNTYRFHRGPKPSLPIEIFAAALSEFWAARLTEHSALTFGDIAYSAKSPGRIFQLDEDTLAEYLDRLENLTDGAFRYDETAGVKQVYRDRKIASTELLYRYYLK